MILTIEQLTTELETWDNFKAYLESLPSNQVGGLTANAKFHPVGLYLRIKYQNKSVDVNPVLSAIDDCEVLTPIWIRKYLDFFLGRQEEEAYSVQTCLNLLDRIIEDLSPPVEQPE
ncbi:MULTISPECIES: hypothetical protein [unclassified Nostoc]|uniref:hypothetical protein n=1 Tax=unclassified Nostoc TaxID=2593658 RepID=UPI002AD27DD4|nr:hypothetical protein [Nostoc sp. DedQUE03]MDZ7975751.1 hypothetical protein [Nostoc sp. DedQUE03]MDZ8048283.1 hypothetical protein [Nostoc sp. DedQUE02]